MSQENIDLIFEKLFDYFSVGSITDLSKKMGIPQSTIAKWKQRKSISAIKKACREQKIFEVIFGSFKETSISHSIGNVSNNNNINQGMDAFQKISLNSLSSEEEILLKRFRKATDSKKDEILLYVMQLTK